MRSRDPFRRSGPGHRMAGDRGPGDPLAKGSLHRAVPQPARVLYLSAWKECMMAAREPVLAAGIVVYRPEPGPLKALIASLLRQVDVLYLYRNSPIPADLLGGMPAHGKQLQFLGDGRNAGLGVAYNRMVEAAMACSIEHILLFDQDSTVPPGLPGELLVRLRSLIDTGERPAVVGPRPIDREGRPYKVPGRCPEAARAGAVVPVQFVISSGSLIDARAFREIGAFRE